jgi:hypothetical protein
VLGAGTAPADAGHRLADPDEPTLPALAAGADYVVIAAGPLLETSETGALAVRADAAILTVQGRRSTHQGLREALRRVAPTPVVGAVVVPAGWAEPAWERAAGTESVPAGR